MPVGRVGAGGPVTAAARPATRHLVVFTRDLRVADHPALATAARQGEVVCAFVLDEAITRSRPRNALRDAFLLQSLADLDASLHRLGSRLVLRQGDWAAEVLALAAEVDARAIHLSEDVTPFARARSRRLAREAARSVEIVHHPGLTLVAPGAIVPAGGDHYQVFTPYYRRWLSAPTRELLPVPRALRHADTSPPGTQPPSLRLRPPRTSGVVGPGGERAATTRLARWLREGPPAAGPHEPTLSAPGTSGLSAYLHFGCISPRQMAQTLAGTPGTEALLRRLCWRDFYLQLLAARPAAAWNDYVVRELPVRRDLDLLEAWRNGHTGFPVVDAAMRQLGTEGFLPNRARMIAASFLTKHLQLDWRDGARQFLDRLIDADVALNNLNWQWMAGRGTGSNPYRLLDPARQARLFDPDGSYVRRYVPELGSLEAPRVHDPDPDIRARLSYPPAVMTTSAADLGARPTWWTPRAT